MIQITPQMRILLAVEPVDFRRGIDGLAALCRQALASDPQAGALFVFCSRRRHVIKCLTYDGQGFCLFQKRLPMGRLTGWPKAGSSASLRLDPHQLHLLLWEQPRQCTLSDLGPLEMRQVRRTAQETLFGWNRSLTRRVSAGPVTAPPTGPAWD